MKAHRIETKLTENGTLTINNLPFQAGETVEIIVLESSQSAKLNLYPLRGKEPYSYDDPFGSAIPLEDWEALQ